MRFGEVNADVLLDLSCPVDMLRVEVLRDSGGRAQAYLTCKNLSNHTVIGMRGEIFHPQSAQAWPFTVQGFAAEAGEQFSPCAWLEDMPAFKGAVAAQIHAVSFADAADWEEDAAELIHCPEENLPPGQERVELVAVEGRDAICWPHRFQHAWRCVCGRYNLPIDAACVRCARDREEVFAYCLPDVVHKAYLWQQNQKEEQQAKQQRKARRQQRVLISQRRQDFARKKQRFRERRLQRKWILVAILAVAAGAIVWWLHIRGVIFAG